MSFMCDQPGPSRATTSNCYEPMMSSYMGHGPMVSSHMGPGTMMGSHMGPETMMGSHMGPGTMMGSHMGPGTMMGSHMGPGTMMGSHMGPGTMMGSHMGPGTMMGSHMGPGTMMGSHMGPGHEMSSASRPGPVMRSLTTQTDPVENSISTQTEDVEDYSSLPDPWVLPNPDRMIDQWIENFELDDEDEFNSNIRHTLLHSLSHFSQLMPEERPPLPHFPLHKTTIEIIGVLGVYLQPYLDVAHPSRTMSILYCGAIAACRLAGIELPAELIARSTCTNPYCHLLRGFIGVPLV